MTCVHRWLLEMPHGPTTPGTCRYCGEDRVFSNDSGHVFGKHNPWVVGGNRRGKERAKIARDVEERIRHAGGEG